MTGRTLLFALSAAALIGGLAFSIWQLVLAARTTDNPAGRRRSMLLALAGWLLAMLAVVLLAATSPWRFPSLGRAWGLVVGVGSCCNAFFWWWEWRRNRATPVAGLFVSDPQVRGRLLVGVIGLSLLLAVMEFVDYAVGF